MRIFLLFDILYYVCAFKKDITFRILHYHFFLCKIKFIGITYLLHFTAGCDKYLILVRFLPLVIDHNPGYKS